MLVILYFSGRMCFFVSSSSAIWRVNHLRVSPGVVYVSSAFFLHITPLTQFAYIIPDYLCIQQGDFCRSIIPIKVFLLHSRCIY